MTTLPRPRNYGRLAWWIIIGSFVLFCGLMVGLCYGVWRVKAFAQGQPDQPATLVHQVSGVEILRNGMAQYELPTPPQTVLYEGDTVRVAANVPPGIAATVTVFDGSRIELWPGTLITLDKVQTTRFSTRNQQVAVRLHSGLMRLHLTPPTTQQYQNVRYSVIVERPGQPTEQAELAVGGSYRVRILAADAPTTSASERMQLPKRDSRQTEYVSERGTITLGFGAASQRVEAGEMIRLVDEQVPVTAPAQWQFVRDTDFTAFSEREYNNNTESYTKTDVVRADTWRVYGEKQSTDAPADGYFFVVGGCAERNTTDATCVQPLIKVAQFRRDTTANIDHTKGFKTAITQTLALDVTPYNNLHIQFTGRIYVQSLNRAGLQGTECALGVVVRYTDLANLPASQTYCYYAQDRDDTTDVVSDKAEITSQYIPLRLWQELNIDLAPILPNMRRLDHLEFYGNGHDYVSEIANVQLFAK